MTVEVSATIAALDRWIDNVSGATDDIAHEGAEGVRRLYQTIAPKLTGRMVASTTVTRVGPDSYVTGPTVVYGRFREFGGTLRPLGHPYLKFIYRGSTVYARRVHQKGSHSLKAAVEAYERPYQELAYRKWLEAQEAL